MQGKYVHRMNNAPESLNNHSTPNRWHTTVSVEVYINRRMRYIKWFSDLQMAYLWVASQERVINEPLAYNHNFVEFADAFDRRWQERPTEGSTMATSSTYRYRLYYEPDVPYRPHEEQQRNNIHPNQQQNALNNFVFYPMPIINNQQAQT